MEKVSVVIPVHNGGKYIEKTVRKILSQTYKNVEVVLVENFSSDNSLEICKKLETENNRVTTAQSFERGTSFARKKGVEIATGKYILFSDQDDGYKNNKAIEEMYKTINDLQVDIVQFACYFKYKSGIKIKKSLTKEVVKLSAEDFKNKHIQDIFYNGEGIFSVHTWDKIYKAEVLKSAVKTINSSVFFIEDINLNSRVFMNEKVKSVAVSPDGYYVWSVGVGFSSVNGAMTLAKDYENVKPVVLKLFEENNIDKKVIERYHLHSLYFCKEFIIELIKKGTEKEEVKKVIEEINSYHYMDLAKEYFRKWDKEKIWDDLEVLINYQSTEQYYEMCVKSTSNLSTISKLKGKLKKIIRG